MKPNIIFIFCDQLRWDTPSYAGGPAQTPNLDYLAARGTRFGHTYSAVPSCIPARAILWTGQNQWHTGVLGMGRGQGQVPHDFPHTLAGELTASGYETRMVGKGHFWPQRCRMGFEQTELDESGRTLIQGFSDDYREWFGRHTSCEVGPDDHGVNWNSWHARPWHTTEGLHPTAWTMNRSLDFLAARDQSRPFFLNISFARPHSPYVPPRPYWDAHQTKESPKPARGAWSSINQRRGDSLDPNAWRGRMTDAQIARARGGYYGEVAFIDAQIGRLLNWMQRFAGDELARTWFVFSADHGDMLGDHDLWRKTYAYEGSAHVPLLVVPPLAGPRPERSLAEEVVELQDIMPTILSIAEVPVPVTVDGQSLIPLTEAPDGNWRRYIHGEHCTCYSPEQEMQYVTDGLRKLIWFPRTGEEQFFDLEQDPSELNELSGDAERRDEIDLWRDRLVSTLAKRDCGWVLDGRPHCPGAEPLVSPYRDVRWRG